MAFDASRVHNNAQEIQDHLEQFASGVSSVDDWEIVPETERAAYVVVTIEYTA